MTASPSSCLLPLLLLTSAASALLWPALGPNFWKNGQQPSFTKICLYSNDPGQFTPLCIMCPNTLYPIVLTTCVMGVAIPLNVSYTQANCIVGNCAVNLSPAKPGVKGRREAPHQSVVGITQEEENDHISGSVPYTVMVDGQNVTVTSVEEYFVQSDQNDDYEAI